MNLNPRDIKSIIQSEANFSGVVQVRQRDQIIISEAYGLANRADHLANTVDTRFGIASGTKTLTGVAVCQLIEQGKLTLGTRLQDVVDADFPQFDPSITINQLLTHTSGAPDYFDEEKLDAQGDFGALWADRPTYTMKTPRDFLPMFQNEPMKFAPGKRFSYNNGGFILLGLVIEAVSGQSYIDYMTEHVLAKAGMTDSGFFALDQLPSRTAQGYIDHEDGSWQTNIFQIPIIGGPDGGVFVTAPDVSKFWDALRSHQLLGQAMTAKVLHPYVNVKPDDANNPTYYGMGIWLKCRDEQVTCYQMQGADPGVSFISAVYPAHDHEITVISNTEHGVWDIFRQIANLIE